MTSEPKPTPACCGVGGAWTPKPGEDQIPSCQVCPRSGDGHWRKRQG